MIGNNFKEHCKALDKHIYFPELKEIFEIFSEIVSWNDRDVLKEGYYYFSIRRNESIPESEKNITVFHSSYAVRLKKPYKIEVDKWLCDEYDSIHFELIDWGSDGVLLTASNNKIISNRWLNLLTIYKGINK